MKRYCIFFFVFLIVALVAPIAGEDEGKLVGTWCSMCNGMIPAGQTCPHMGGGSSSSNKGDSSSSGGGAVRESKSPSQIREERGAELNGVALGLYNQEDFEGALRLFYKALRMSPEDETIRTNIGLTLNELGLLAFDKGDFRKALKKFKEALKYIPDDENILYNYNLTLDRMNKKDLPSLPTPGTPHDQYPNVVWAENGRFRPAPGYQWVNPNDPNDFHVELIHEPGTPDIEHPNTVWGNNSQIHPAPGYHWANPNDPNDFRVEPNVTIKEDERHNNQGTQLLEQKNYLDAAVEFRKAWELVPDNNTYARNWGLCLQALFNPVAEERKKNSDYLGAAEVYQKLLKELPVNYTEGRAECHTQLGTMLSHVQGKEAEAYANLKAGAELNPQNAANLRALGEFLMARGMNSEAAVIFQKSMELEGDEGDVEVNWLMNMTKSRAERESRAAEKYGIKSLNNANITNIKRGASIVFDDIGRGAGSDPGAINFSKMDQPIQWPEKFNKDPKFSEMKKELDKYSNAEKKIEKEFQQIQQKRLDAAGPARAQLAVQEAYLKQQLNKAEYDRKMQEKKMKQYIVKNI